MPDTPKFAGELYAGRGGMLEEAEKRGYQAKVICEREPHLRHLLRRKFKNADIQPDMDKKPWIQWAACGITIYLLIAGFACQPFSSAGKMLEQNDPRAFQAVLVIEAAIALGVTELLLENVPGLVDNDWRHGVYTMIKIKLHVAGFGQHRCVKAKDEDVLGDTGRDRAFLWFKRGEGQHSSIRRLRLAPRQSHTWPASVPIHDKDAIPWGRASMHSSHRAGGPSGKLTLSTGLGKLGQAVTLLNSDRVWRVMEERGSQIKVMDVNRRDPVQRRAWTEEVVARDTNASTFNVYKPGNKMPTLTASGEPPRYGAPLVVNSEGDAFTMGVRARAHLHGVPRWEVQFLLEVGCSTQQMRAVFGGMVTTAAATAIFDELITPAREILQKPTKKPATGELDALRAAALASMANKGTGQWSGKLVAAEAHQKGERLVLLMPVHRQRRLLQTDGSKALGVRVPIHQLATGKITQQVQHLLPSHELALAGRCTITTSGQETEEVTVVVALSLVEGLPLPTKTLQQLEDSSLYEAAALALARSLSYGGDIDRSDMQPLLDITGASLGGAAPPAPAMAPAAAVEADADRARKLRETKITEAERHHTEMRKQLLLLADEEQHCIIRNESKADYLREWTQQLTNAADYMKMAPDSAFLHPVQFSDDRLRLMAFVDTAPINPTKRLPPVPEQEPLPADFKPKSLRDLQMPGHVDVHTKMLAKHAAFIRNIRDTKLDREQLARIRPRPSAFSERKRVPQVRGRVMDLRGKEPTLLKMNAPVECALDAKYMRKMLPNHLDEQILQHVEEGVRSQTNLKLQTVLQSHLLSLANHTEELGKDIERRHKIKYLERHAKQPFDPIRLVVQGTVAKLNSIRQVTDLGQPHRVVLDDEAEQVQVYNQQATTNEDGSPKLPREWKALAPHVLQNMAALRYIGDLIKMVLCMFSDDLKDFFRQLAVHSSELHKLCFLWIDSEDDAEFIEEKRLGFGPAHASNVAQRLANAVIKIFHIEFRKADAPYLEADCKKYPLLREWLRDRTAALGADMARVHDACFYTDDLHAMVLGEERYARATGVWFEVTRKINLLCSAPKKRMSGVAMPWCGIAYFSTLGGACLPEDKRANAQRVLVKAATGECPVSEYRAVVGLLEWARYALCISAISMYCMYGPMQRGQELSSGPATLVKNTDSRKSHWKMWSNMLATAAFAAATAVLGDRPQPSPSSPVHVWHGDAVIKGTVYPGLCGVWQGMYWIIPLSKQQLEHLTISPLELLVVMINFAVFGPMLRLLEEEQLSQMTILLQCDSLVSTRIITGKRRGTAVKSAAKSPIMQHIHESMTALPEYSRLHSCVVAGHEWGEGNVVSDAGSRGREDKLIHLCDLLGVKARRIEVPEGAKQFVEEAARYAAALDNSSNQKTKKQKTASTQKSWAASPTKQAAAPSSKSPCNDSKQQGTTQAT